MSSACINEPEGGLQLAGSAPSEQACNGAESLKACNRSANVVAAVLELSAACATPDDKRLH